MSSVIELRGVGKRYQKLEEQAMLLRSVLPFARPGRAELWALRNLDLTVDAGEVIGVLGHNGAGKTTLLRLLAGVTTPTEGRVRVVGRIAPLISLGVGFHQEMSGRENVLVNGMLLGLSARQVAERFDQIVEFAEVGEFIDTPVKFYSSGMFMRLGFAVVVHVDPKILLVDEILAVGDAAFQLKCFARLRALQQQGAAIVMVSHSMHMIRQLCPRALLIRHGQLEYDGDVETAIALHCESMSVADELGDKGNVVEVLERRLIGGHGADHHAEYDQQMELQVRLRFHRAVREALITFAITTETGFPAASHTSSLNEGRAFECDQEIVARIPFRARLGGGNYALAVHLRGQDGEVLGACENLMMFVAGRPGSLGVIDLRARIEIDDVDRTDLRSTLLEI
jgi:ABC-type polysaccharide/polyol phosphate transport system ATPase subunit